MQTLPGLDLKLVFRVSPQQRLIIVAHALDQMKTFAQHRWWQPEAGGVLLGRHLLDSADVVVDEVTTPQSSDRRSRFGFFRSKQHENLARKRWREEKNSVAYLGLWHTHPEDDPSPSSVDYADWRQAVAGDAFEGDQLFFPIVGRKRIRVWCLGRRGTIEELEEVKNG